MTKMLTLNARFDAQSGRTQIYDIETDQVLFESTEACSEQYDSLALANLIIDNYSEFEQLPPKAPVTRPVLRRCWFPAIHLHREDLLLADRPISTKRALALSDTEMHELASYIEMAQMDSFWEALEAGMNEYHPQVKRKTKRVQRNS